jgi:hypothetical protein
VLESPRQSDYSAGMSEQDRLNAEKFVLIHKARDEYEGNLIVDYLRDNGVDATFQAAPSMPPLDFVEEFSGADRALGIFVLQHNAARAAEMVSEFMHAATDETVLAESAAQRLHVDREKIHQLRGAIREERRTFEFLGWVAMAFLGAAALLWAIWPAWLKLNPPTPEFRWIVVALLALAALVAGNYARRKL